MTTRTAPITATVYREITKGNWAMNAVPVDSEGNRVGTTFWMTDKIKGARPADDPREAAETQLRAWGIPLDRVTVVVND